MSMPGNNALPGPEGLGQGGQTGRRNCKPLKYINKKNADPRIQMACEAHLPVEESHISSMN
jgi:hypothetical protein